MGIIKDSNFCLQIIYPEIFIGNFEKSANQPVHIWGRDKASGAEGEFVLKPTGAGRMHQDAILFELVASLLALELGIQTPKPCLVEVDQDFVDLFLGNLSFTAMQKSIGLNYATSYQPGYFVWKPDNLSKISLRKSMESVFIFDMFIENVDRSKIKPNMITNGLDILILDHEIAFSFAMALGYDNPTPWKIRVEDVSFLQAHIFFNFFKQKKIKCDSFIEIYSSIDNEFWDKVETIIPDSYLQNTYSKIKDFLSRRVSHMEIFLNEIEGVLS